MPAKTKLKRKAFYVDEKKLRRAKRVLNLSSEGEVVRVAVDRALEMEEFWQFMRKRRSSLLSGSVELP